MAKLLRDITTGVGVAALGFVVYIISEHLNRFPDPIPAKPGGWEHNMCNCSIKSYSYLS